MPGMVQQPAYLIPGLPSAMGNFQFITTDSAGNLAAGSLAAGYIPFGSASSAFSSSSNLFWDAANSRLGLGTTSPSALLTVNGVGAFGAGATASPSIAAFGNLSTGMWFPAANSVAWSVGGNEAARFLSSAQFLLGRTSAVGSEQFSIRQGAGNDGVVLTDGVNAAFYWSVGAGSASYLGCTGAFYLGSGGGAAQRLLLDFFGNVVQGTAAVATTATDGFTYIVSCPGTPTGVPRAYAGRVPLIVDSTNNKLYFYSGGAWRDAGP